MFLNNFKGVRDYIVVANTNAYSLQDIMSQQIIQAPYESLEGIKNIERDSKSLIIPGQQVTLFTKWDGSRWAVYTLRPGRRESGRSVHPRMTEGQETEFKQGLGSFVETVCAFANTNGGTLWVGYDDDGSVRGIEALLEKYGGQDKLSCYLRNRLSQTTNTLLFMNVKFFFVDRNGHTTLKVFVPRCKDGEIVLYRDALYIRDSNTTRRLSSDRMLSYICNKMKINTL